MRQFLFSKILYVLNFLGRLVLLFLLSGDDPCFCIFFLMLKRYGPKAIRASASLGLRLSIILSDQFGDPVVFILFGCFRNLDKIRG